MKTRRLAATTGTVLAALTFASCGLGSTGPSSSGDASTHTVVIAHTGPKGNSVYDFFESFSKELENDSHGKFTTEVHPAGELGGDQQLVEAMRLGSVSIASAATSNMASYTDAYEWADLPYVFKNNESAAKLWKSDLAKQLNAQVAKDVNTHVLAYINAGGFRLLANTKKQIRTPKDTMGMKIRTTDSPLEAAITSAWGANPTPVAWSDTFSAVQQGVVDGLQLQPEWLDLNGFGSVVRHATKVRALMAFHVVQVSDKFWKQLSQQDQQLFTQIAQKTADQANNQMAKDYAGHVQALEKDGVTVYSPSPSELKEFEDSAKSTWKDFKDQDTLNKVLELQAS